MGQTVSCVKALGMKHKLVGVGVGDLIKREQERMRAPKN